MKKKSIPAWSTDEKTKTYGYVTFDLPSTLLSTIKAKAAEKHIPYQRFIRQLLEQGVR